MNANPAIKQILAMQTIAVVGLSPKSERPSNGVARYLMDQGYTIIPVNPGHDTILGLRAYPSLKAIPGPVDVVDVFRRAEFAASVAEDAVAIGARAFWLQLWIINDAAVKIAEQGGLLAVQNRCLKIEHAQERF